MDHPNTSSQSATSSAAFRNHGDFISVSEALKLIPPFKGNKQEIVTFIGNVDTAFAVIDPEQEATLYKFMLTRISGEPRIAINHRNFDKWAELREFLSNSYIERRTLDYHASQLFKARQTKDERVTDWIQRIQALGAQFREAALLNCSEGAREGILDLSDRLRNICFVQGLAADRIQTIVRSRNQQNFDEIAETALVEESAMASKQDRYRPEGASVPRCTHCGKSGHSSSKCYSRGRVEAQVNPIVASGFRASNQTTCFRCGEKGHWARNCRKPPRRKENSDNRETSENESKRTEPSGRRVQSIGCINTDRCDYVTFELEASKGDKLYFLVDSGADFSLVKSRKLLGTAEFEPEDRVRFKGVDGSTLETHGSIKTQIKADGVNIPYSFQIVNKQIDLKGDGILGRDFFEAMKAQICYKDRLLSFQYKGTTVRKELGPPPGVEGETSSIRSTSRLTIPARTEMIVRLPVNVGAHVKEGLVDKSELCTGVYVADSLVTVSDGYVLTSVLNTRDQEIELPNSVRLTVLNDDNKDGVSVMSLTEQSKDKGDQNASRGERIMGKLRTGHLNDEEKKSLFDLCFDYQDVFYLPGDGLSATNAVRHSIPLEPGATPVNTRPYRLPESQKEEIDRQVKQLLEEGIIKKSDSPWNSPLLVVEKKAGPDGQRKWRMVVDFRKLNEKTIGNAYPLPDITEILDQLGQSKYFTCLDMVMGYHQIELEQGEGPKTAFSTKHGHWEFNRLPFGLKTAGATFQKMMNSVLSGLTGTRCFVYLDDIVLYAKSLEDHNTKLREVLDRLRTYKLKLQPDKCEFLRKEVNYLGHWITETGVRPDPKKVAAVDRFPTPTNQKELKTFCGMISYYRRFIPNCSRVASPCTNF